MNNSKLVRAGRNTVGPRPAALVGGEGAYLDYSDGTRILDASNTGGPLGHAHPAMVEAVVESARFPVATEGQMWAERDAAADELVDIAFAGEDDWVGGVRFGLSGSEVNDIALSLAQALTGRDGLVARERAYHGLVGLSRDVTVQPQWHGGLSLLSGGVSVPSRSADVRTIAGPDGAIWTNGDSRSPNELSDRDLTDALTGAAAVIVDYTQGGRYYEADYQEHVAAAARAAGAIWIADEVVTGLGRSGSWFAFQGAPSRPDMVTMGKPLAGGAAPAGAVVLSKAMLELLRDVKWQNYSTFRAHPAMIHAARAHLRVVQSEGLVERAEVAGVRFAEGLLAIADRHPSVERIAGKGMHWTIELRGVDWKDWLSDTSEVQIADSVAAVARSKGVHVGTSDEATSLFVAPPLIVTDAEIDRILDAVDEGLFAADTALAQAVR
ncbi:aminotransferase class III-fold pyridoxal phosphate-dependent enzyme [Rhodococcoides kyotonense]|uniref:4-aminobutyrate aminotransferase n=1 Tax=Rhodococcoides kyotonense TaxID=398843 RepID=A0A239JXQ4_9NOCA|nr:aminotransferase class III-fold pyridoxal phosphate-dependent enzyme [Rhodococcus kyotonensis]SNT10439.1 4-aminobutyrate aminotransferase [Rhodococcus kyotonensis]